MSQIEARKERKTKKCSSQGSPRKVAVSVAKWRKPQRRSKATLAVIEAVEGPMALTRCLDESMGCEHAGGCALCGLFAEAQERVKELLAPDRVALLQLVATR